MFCQSREVRFGGIFSKNRPRGLRLSVYWGPIQRPSLNCLGKHFLGPLGRPSLMFPPWFREILGRFYVWNAWSRIFVKVRPVRSVIKAPQSLPTILSGIIDQYRKPRCKSQILFARRDGLEPLQVILSFQCLSASWGLNW